MNENINLCEILKGHEGETFYSPIFGDIIFLSKENEILIFDSCDENDNISDENCHTNILLYSNGKYYKQSDEIAVFPSKDQRDWNKWLEEQKSKVPKTWSEIIVDKHSPMFDICLRPVHDGNYQNYHYEINYGNSSIEKSALALFKILQLIEVGYGGNVLCNKKGHWNGGIYGYTISIRPSSKTYLDCYDIIPIERRNDVVSPIMFKTKEYAEEFIKHEENCSLFRIFNMVSYPRDIK